jgi:hypothetical protein
MKLPAVAIAAAFACGIVQGLYPQSPKMMRLLFSSPVLSRRQLFSF